LKYNLRDYQIEDIEKMGAQESVQLLNPMGFGKTREGVERDRLIRESGTFDERSQTLVICPSSARRGWLNHFRDYQPDLRVAVFDNEIRDIFLRTLRNPAFQVLIVPWQALRVPPRNSDRRNSWAQTVFYPALTISKISFLHVIADEAHRAKSMKAQQTRALKKIRALYKTAVTGTPMPNYPEDWFSLLNWLKPRDYTSFWKFYEQYVEYETVYAKHRQFKQAKGAKNTSQLWKAVEPFTVMQPKDRLGLGEPIYTPINVDLTPRQRDIYDQMKSDMVAWLGEQEDTPLIASVVVAKLQRMQQFAIASARVESKPHSHRVSCKKDCQKTQDDTVILEDPSSKIDAVMDLIEDNPNEKFVVYSQFRGACDLLGKRLASRSIKHGTYYGGVSSRDRDQIVADFSGGRLPVFIATIGAGGEAIDGLQNHCNKVIFIDRAWTPAANDQAEGRIQRSGQKRRVQVIDIIANNTVDFERMEQVDLKRQWIQEMLKGAA
jgi:SNF2 family DNA or RNA helicase